MAKPGLVLPRIYPTDAISGARIDEHVRAIADQINGGLTATNIAQGTKFANSAFLENRSVVVVANSMDCGNGAQAAASRSFYVGVTPSVPSRVLGFEFVGFTFNSTNVQLSVPLSLGISLFNVGANGVQSWTVQYNFQTTAPVSVFSKIGTLAPMATATGCIAVSAPVFAPADVPASQVIAIYPSFPFNSVWYGKIYASVTLSVAHQA